MEHRNVRNRGVMNEDRISQLPEALILHILSLLPTKLVISTSVLSKQWRSRWKMVPNLQFGPEDYESEHHTFSEIVSKTFLSHKAPVLKSFHLSFGLDKVTPIDIGLWVGMAFARNLRELVLDFHYHQDTILFPSSFFTCSTLETLKLETWMTVDISYPVYMKSLKTLHLSCLHYKDDASVRNLLSGCPSLEDLVVHVGDDCGVEIFTIEVPSLKRLSIFDDTGPEFRGYLITAPSLKSLLIEMLRCHEFSLNAPGLVEAHISEVYYLTIEKYLGSLTSVKRFALDILPVQITYPTGCIFYQLVSLEMFMRKTAEWWSLFTFMLENSPRLQVLKLTDHCLKFHRNRLVSIKWNEPKYVPECLLSHLETFVWTRFQWGREEEKEVATYILKNARQLKKATFSTDPIESEELNKLKERSKMLSELDDVDRASDSCHLVFEFDSTCYESDFSEA